VSFHVSRITGNADYGPADQTCGLAIGYNAAANPNLNLNPNANT